MCINQILKSEQIALMRYAAATDLTEARRQRRKLHMFEHMLAAHPYAHRPCFLENLIEGSPGQEGAAKQQPLLERGC
jgi:hypothetical protein